MRTQIIYQWAITHGSHWHLKAELFRDAVIFEKQQRPLQQEISRSDETFIKHYTSTYSIPQEPPAWMSLEVSSFGLLSLMFQNLKTSPEKNAVLQFYGLKDIKILENWMHAISNLRNICAHHGRVWNRRFTTHIKIPYNTQNKFISNRKILPFKIYPALCCIKYLLDIITPQNIFVKEIAQLLHTFPEVQLNEMGFPENWQSEDLWQ